MLLLLLLLLTVVGFAMSFLTLVSGGNFSLTCSNISLNDKDLELWKILYVQVGH